MNKTIHELQTWYRCHVHEILYTVLSFAMFSFALRLFNSVQIHPESKFVLRSLTSVLIIVLMKRLMNLENPDYNMFKIFVIWKKFCVQAHL